MGFRFLPYKKAKKGVQIAGVDYDDSGGGGGGSYTLPPATASTLGGIKVGSNLSVESDGTLSGSAPYTLPIASSGVLGGVKVGSGLTINDGVLSATGSSGGSYDFSTTEFNTGQKWIDNKSIYGIVLKGIDLSRPAQKLLSASVSSISFANILGGFASVMIDSTTNIQFTTQLKYQTSDNKVYFTFPDNAKENDSDAFCVIYYTKSTT